MDTLFGVSMDTWMAIMLTLFLIVTGVVAMLALRNRLFLKLGLRNLPRRRAQTVLIVIGLMLATVIITSALGVGDTISYSLRSGYVQSLGPVDELVGTQSGFSNGATSYFPVGITTQIRQRLAAVPVAGVAPSIVETVAIQDLTTRQTKARMGILGVPVDYPAAFSGITSTDGTPVSLSGLAANHVYLNELAARSLGAHAGDTLVVFFNGKPANLVVRSVVRNENLAAGGLSALNGSSRIADPAILLPLDRLQALAGQPERINLVLVSNTGDSLTGARLSDAVADQLRALLADSAQLTRATMLLASPSGQVVLKAVAGQSSVSTDATLKRDFADLATLVPLAAPTQAQRDRVAAILSNPSVLATFTSYKPDRLIAGQYQQVAAPLGQALVSISSYQVSTIKQSILDAANLVGSIFTGLFIIFGIFSVVAGIMLIFLIFVMIAAERRAEMGMARAVGTKRRDLIQQFLFEGYAYNLGSALVGIVLGVGVSLVMASVLNGLLGTSGLDLHSHIQGRTLVVAFCLGALITFLTVAVSSWRASRLNVVAAIRDLPEDFGSDVSLGGAWKRTVGNFLVNPRRHTIRFLLTLLALVLGVATLRFGFGILLLLLVIWPIFAALTSRGPVLILAGLVVTGLSESHTPPNGPVFRIGISLLLIGVAMLLRWILGGARVPDRIRNRIGYTLAGVAVVAFYLIPVNAFHAAGKPDFDTGPYQILLSGVMLVLGSVWAVMFNADLLLKGILLAFGGNGRLAPSLKMAVSYPMQNKFRTGLTVAMFSLVIFILMLVAVLLTSTRSTLNLDRDLGGFAIYGATSPLNPIRNADQTVAANPTLHAAIDGAGGLATLQVGLRQPGRPDQSFQDYNAKVADDGYLLHQRWALQSHASGYSDAQVWRALRTTPGVAVVSGDLLPRRTGSGGRPGNGFQISGVYYEDQNFDPAALAVQMIDHRTNTVLSLRVIGVISRSAVNNLQELASGVYIGQPTLAAAHDAPAIPTTFFFHLAPGQDRHQAALVLGSAFLANGLDVKETQVEYDNNQAITNGLFNLIEGFMGLGLTVGVAALGVVSLRSVVERRQQIGMMRAIGFQRSMIRSSFLLESSFISILGTVLGVVLGVLLANQYIAEQAKIDPTIHLVIPWPQVLIILVIAYGASLITTYLPARQASRIYPAEALRYE